MKEVTIEPNLESWRAAARRLLEDEVPPSEVLWREKDVSGPDLSDDLDLGAGEARREPSGPTFHVPRAFLELASDTARGSDPQRWPLLYSVLWRLIHEDRNLLKLAGDSDVSRLNRMAEQARRRIAPSQVQDQAEGEPVEKRPAAIPSRLEGRLEGTLREAAAQPGLFAEGTGSFGEPMPRRKLSDTRRSFEAAQPGAPPTRGAIPETRDLEALRQAAVACQACDLYRNATQTVFGKGPARATVVFVGEQPGDAEDRQGAPFVGPAGEVFDRALAEAGLDRSEVYVTNVVKHFKWIERGKRRIHQNPGSVEIAACRPWLEAELEAIRPQILVCLGATAARALLGADFRIMRERGRLLEDTGWAPKVLATLHPSAVLRADPSAQQSLYEMLLADLRLVAREVARSVKTQAIET